jgi:hypothetical protein
MQLLIPYKYSDVHLSVKSGGNLMLTISSDDELLNNLLNQLFDAVSYQEFINTIGTQQFEQLLEFYNSPDFEE